jgi:hypothetical protein
MGIGNHIRREFVESKFAELWLDMQFQEAQRRLEISARLLYQGNVSILDNLGQAWNRAKNFSICGWIFP